VDEIGYTADSGSWNQQINALEQFTASAAGLTTGSLLTTASFASQNLTFTKGDGSQFSLFIPDNSGSVLPSGVVSGSSQITELGFVSSSVTGSSLVTASFSGNTLTFTKGDSSTFGIVIPDNSGSSIASLNAFTASQELINSGVNAFTASTQIRLTNIESTTASLDAEVTSLQVFTQSQQTENTLNQTKWSNLGNQSGSFVTESETGSFARTDVTNTFTQDQIIQGTLTAYTMSADTLNVRVLNTTIESSSVIFSSGSNVLGDAANDTQTLNGSVRIVNELTASGLRYPTTDGTVEQFLNTNGTGTLSFANVRTLYQNIRNREATPILKGTPLFASGSTGDNVDVYIADAGNPLRMPATLIAGDTTLAAGGTGRAIIIGHIEGVDTTGYPAGTQVYVAVGGGWTATRPTGSATPVQPLGIVTRQGNNGMGIVLTELPNSLPNIQTGYAWVGDGTNQPVAVPTSSFGGGGTINTGSFATTGSNTFVGTQNIKNSLIIEDPTNQLIYTQLDQNSVNGLFQFYQAGGNGYQFNNNVQITGDLTASLQEGYVWVGDSSGRTTTVATSSFGGGGTINTGSFATTGSNTFVGNQFISSSDIFLTGSGGSFVNIFQNSPGEPTSAIRFYSGSTIDQIGRGGQIRVGGNGTSINIGSFGAGQTSLVDFDFINLQTLFSQNLRVVGSKDFRVVGSGSDEFSSIGPRGTISLSSGSSDIVFNAAQIPFGTETVNYNTINRAGDDKRIILDIYNLESTLALNITATGSFIQDFSPVTNVNENAIKLQPYSNYQRGQVTILRDLDVSGSTSITGTLTSSLQQGYVWVGNANGRTTTVPTSSFGGGGSAFPFTGDAQISGSLGVTGSMSGFVNTLSVASSTASVNFNDGNMFTLTLPTGSITHITPTNIKRGQTINIQINQPNDASTGSVSFSSNVLFAGGADYQSTATGSAIDLLTFISLDGTNVLATSIKNFQ
jgi:hypothetical protein